MENKNYVIRIIDLTTDKIIEIKFNNFIVWKHITRHYRELYRNINAVANDPVEMVTSWLDDAGVEHEYCREKIGY